jgi:hypothetical protein
VSSQNTRSSSWKHYVNSPDDRVKIKKHECTLNLSAPFVKKSSIITVILILGLEVTEKGDFLIPFRLLLAKMKIIILLNLWNFFFVLFFSANFPVKSFLFCSSLQIFLSSLFCFVLLCKFSCQVFFVLFFSANFPAKSFFCWFLLSFGFIQ